jgi:site-specific recombinase XerC
MAQRLESRHPSRVRLWHYTLADYQKSLSEVVLSENRLNKLKKLNSPKLAAVKEFMMETKRAGYQEKLIDAFLYDMTRGQA